MTWLAVYTSYHPPWALSAAQCRPSSFVQDPLHRRHHTTEWPFLSAFPFSVQPFTILGWTFSTRTLLRVYGVIHIHSWELQLHHQCKGKTLCKGTLEEKEKTLFLHFLSQEWGLCRRQRDVHERLRSEKKFFKKKMLILFIKIKF